MIHKEKFTHKNGVQRCILMRQPGMVVRCECDAKNCENATFFFAVVVRCGSNFDSVFASHSHFALFRMFSHFCHIFSHFLILFGALTVKHGAKSAKMRKKCENAMRKRCDAMGLAKSANAKNISHYHPWRQRLLRANRYKRISRKPSYFIRKEFNKLYHPEKKK